MLPYSIRRRGFILSRKLDGLIIFAGCWTVGALSLVVALRFILVVAPRLDRVIPMVIR